MMQAINTLFSYVGVITTILMSIYLISNKVSVNYFKRRNSELTEKLSDEKEMNNMLRAVISSHRIDLPYGIDPHFDDGYDMRKKLERIGFFEKLGEKKSK